MSQDLGDIVTELDFVIFMLIAMKKVDGELVDKIRDHFRRLDLPENLTFQSRGRPIFLPSASANSVISSNFISLPFRRQLIILGLMIQWQYQQKESLGLDALR